MSTIQIFDPALCCSSGGCGTDVGQNLVNASADVDWARQNGAQIERFNLAQQPLAFAENPLVKGFLQRSGQEALPLTLVANSSVPACPIEPAAWPPATERRRMMEASSSA